jgi:hypothetical protein
MGSKVTLYGIGVGPGDADLITVKAVKVLGTVDVIFTASSTKKDSSLAMNIVRPHLPSNVEIRTLSFPMTKDAGVTDKAWLENAATAAEEAIAGSGSANQPFAGGSSITGGRSKVLGHFFQRQRFHQDLSREGVLILMVSPYPPLA